MRKLLKTKHVMRSLAVTDNFKILMPLPKIRD
jgi:hypothetical protein